MCRVSRARCAPCCQRTWAPRWLCRGNAAPKASPDPRGSAIGACLWVQRSSVTVLSCDACQGSAIDSLGAGLWSSNCEQICYFLSFKGMWHFCLPRGCVSVSILRSRRWSSSRNEPDVMSKVYSGRKKSLKKKKYIYKIFKNLCVSFCSLCLSQRQVILRLICSGEGILI